MVTTILEDTDPTGEIDPARHIRKWDAVLIPHRKAQPYSIVLNDGDAPRPPAINRPGQRHETIL